MLQVITTRKFEKDYALMHKRGKNLDKLRSVMTALASGKPLDRKYRDHPLSGDWSRHRECHVDPDWLLIYRTNDDSIIFERTGTHSDLFG